MASKENGQKRGVLKTKPLLHLGKYDNRMDDSSERQDSGLGDSIRTEASVTDSYSIDDGESSMQECSVTEELQQKTKEMKIENDVETEVETTRSTDEGYYTLSLENKPAEVSVPSTDSVDGKLVESTKHALIWFLQCFARTNDLRYLLAPLWRLLLVQNEDGDTPLHLAIINCREPIIKAILDVLRAPEYLDIYNDLSQTALHLAVITRQPKIVQKLISLGASVDKVDRNGQTCVHLACKRGYLDVLQAIFQLRPTNVELHEKLQEVLEMRNFEGLTPLCVAVKENHLELAKEVIALGANVNAIDGKSGNTALHLAVEGNNLPMVSCLLFQGNANPNAMSYSESTPLHIAAGLGHEAIVATLIAVGASSSIENFEGDTAFKLASETFEFFQDDDYLELEEMEN